MEVFRGRTADEAWRLAADAVLDAPVVESRAGRTRELLHAALEIEDPTQRWTYSRVPALNPAFALAEVAWIMLGRRDLAYLKFWNNALPEFVGEGPDLHGAYGWRLRRHFGFDQLAGAYDTLRSNRESRQVVLQVWDGRDDLPDDTGRPRNPDIPCNVVAMLKVRGGALHWTQVMRSNDLVLGTPHNFVQWMTLQEVMAGWLGLRVGPHTLYADSLHAYERDLAGVAQAISSPAPPRPENTDRLALGYNLSYRAWRDINALIERLIDPTRARAELERRDWAMDADPAYYNISAVLVAEAARRRGYRDVADRAMRDVTNPAYVALWEAWTARLARPRHA